MAGTLASSSAAAGGTVQTYPAWLRRTREGRGAGAARGGPTGAAVRTGGPSIRRSPLGLDQALIYRYRHVRHFASTATKERRRTRPQCDRVLRLPCWAGAEDTR